MSLSSSITTRLEYQHKSLLEIMEGLTDEQIRLQINIGKWSIFENIVHLTTYQHTFIRRISQVINEENPSFSRYSAETDPLFYDNCERPTREIIVDLINTRKLLAGKVVSLNKEQYMLTGGHPVFGKMNVPEWIEFFLLHEAHHLFTIFKLSAEIKKKFSQTNNS